MKTLTIEMVLAAAKKTNLTASDSKLAAFETELKDSITRMDTLSFTSVARKLLSLGINKVEIGQKYLGVDSSVVQKSLIPSLKNGDPEGTPQWSQKTLQASKKYTDIRYSAADQAELIKQYPNLLDLFKSPTFGTKLVDTVSVGKKSTVNPMAVKKVKERSMIKKSGSPKVVMPGDAKPAYTGKPRGRKKRVVETPTVSEPVVAVV